MVKIGKKKISYSFHEDLKTVMISRRILHETGKVSIKLVQQKEKHFSRKIHISKNGAFREKLRKMRQRKEAMDNIE